MAHFDYQFLTSEPPSDGYDTYFDDFLNEPYLPIENLLDEVSSPPNNPQSQPQTNSKQTSEQLSGNPKGNLQKIIDQMFSEKQMKEYLQLKISGDRKIRFNKMKLFCLFDIFVNMHGWKPLNRTEKRNKDLVFKRLFAYKNVVVNDIEKFPFIIEQVLLCGGKIAK